MKTSTEIKPAQASWPSRKIMTMLGRLMVKNKSFRRRMRLVGELSDYVGWLENNFEFTEVSPSREVLWRRMESQMSPEKSWVAFEFGVAWGYTTNFWMKDDLSKIKEWHGFDRFTGLPRAWRDVSAGEFDANGQTPRISNPRIIWHVGDVEENLNSELVEKSKDLSKIVFFDLDLYEPTAFAFNKLLPHLNSGDFLYFDEAYDNDERRVLDELVIPNVRCEVVGASYMALALRIL